ncbi:hypothetical protein [Larkinella rosea]|uniref:Uncharacterized protein n=1 Tax=Larkinella rosea TaxID=2025312 RepID=A0A3P1C946_9BACT|nr:hypothetical protein [Larkinella rosea]RRB09384.1 hypothetical protein EHT25_00015 [Larkinella rosea]
MKLILHKFILLFFISNYFAAKLMAQNQNLQLTYQYSICDVYYIQDRYLNNTSCITSRTETGGEAGYTRTWYEEEKGYYKMGVVGLPTYVEPKRVKKQEQVPSTYYSYSVFTNTCSSTTRVNAIRKVRLTTGQTMYEDASFYVKPGQSEKRNIKYVDNYNSETAEIGSVIAYKNLLSLDPDEYNKYVNSVINNDKGTLVVTPTSCETRIFLNAGDKVNIKAGGSIRLGAFAGYGGPDGINGFTDYNFTPNARHGALVYTHSGINGWHLAGSNNTLTTDKAGFLWLSLNDKSIDDDEGQFIVNYEIIRAKSTSALNFNSLPQRCSDLEKIAKFTQNELNTYLANNKFLNEGELKGLLRFKREVDSEILVLGFKKKYESNEYTIVFATESKERFLKFKNTISADGYVYKETIGKIVGYRKTNETSQSSIETEIGLVEGDFYQVMINITYK